jgi:c-di-GMP-binding flagellar brake protein YcgR
MEDRQGQRAERFRINLPIVVSIGGSRREYRGVTKDISATGVFFYPDSWEPEATSIQFKMLMPSEVTGGETRRAVCSATVVRLEARSERKGVGVAARIEKITWSS